MRRAHVHALVRRAAVHPPDLRGVGGDPDVPADQEVGDAGPDPASVHGCRIDLRPRRTRREVLRMVPDGDLLGPVTLDGSLDLASANLLSRRQRWHWTRHAVRERKAPVDDRNAGAVHLDLDVRGRDVAVNDDRGGALVERVLHPGGREEVRVIAEIQALAIDDVRIHGRASSRRLGRRSPGCNAFYPGVKSCVPAIRYFPCLRSDEGDMPAPERGLAPSIPGNVRLSRRAACGGHRLFDRVVGPSGRAR